MALARAAVADACSDRCEEAPAHESALGVGGALGPARGRAASAAEDEPSAPPDRGRWRTATPASARAPAPGRRPGRRRSLRLDRPAPGRRTRAISRSPGPSSRRAPTRTCAREPRDAARRAERAGGSSSRGSCDARRPGLRQVDRRHGVRPALERRRLLRRRGGRGPDRYRLRVSRLVGCAAGCEPEPSCSGGRVVGAGGPARATSLWVPASCLTHTGVR